MSDGSLLGVPQALACLRCGGGLDPTPDEAFLHCRYCGTDHEVLEDESVPASMPASWIDSRGSREALRRHLRSRRIRSSIATEVDLHWLVFWRIRAKLIGWQCYQKRPELAGSSGFGWERSSETRSVLPPAERIEELVARDVDVTLPACDTRAFDLPGISDRVDAVEWMPFSSDRLGTKAHVASVVMPRGSALRRAELLRRGGLVPRGATGAVQRVSLLRARARLLYYPVWRIHFTVAGEPGVANVDAVRSRVLGGDCLRFAENSALAWYGAAGAAGWLAGVHPALAAFAFGGWFLHRGSRRGLSVLGTREFAGWLSDELGPRRARPVRLDA